VLHLQGIAMKGLPHVPVTMLLLALRFSLGYFSRKLWPKTCGKKARDLDGNKIGICCHDT
jgi:hypothetical protein